MPIYEYRCDDCKHVFEELLLGRDKDPETCPKCGEVHVARIMSNTSFHLKGTGWYVTDYKSEKPGTVSSNSAETNTENAAATESAPESSAKPEVDTAVSTTGDVAASADKGND